MKVRSSIARPNVQTGTHLLLWHSTNNETWTCRQMGLGLMLRVPWSFLLPSQPAQQFPVDATKAAVAENDNDIAALHDPGEMRDDGVRVRQIRRRFARCADVLH
jgi:hypothetical protein